MHLILSHMDHILNLLPLMLGTWGLTAVAGGTLAGGLLSGLGSRSSANAAAKAQTDSVNATNAANLNLFNLSRGGINPATGYGNSILPTYFGGNEQALGQSAYDNFLKLSGQGNNSYNALQGYQSQLSGGLDNSLNALGNRYNGQDLAQRQAYSNPYYQARTNQAQTYGQGYQNIAAANVSGINTGLSQALNQLNAQRSAQGFLGNSTFDRNRALAATLAARQQAGVMTAQAGAQGQNLMADANLANAGDARSLQFANMDFASNPSALGAGLGAAGQFYNAPGEAMSNSFNTAMSPLNYFRIQPQAFQNAPGPQQAPSLDPAQILGGALSQGASAYGNYQLTNSLLSRYGQSGVNPYTSAASSTGNMFSQYNPYAGWGVAQQANPFLSYGGGAPNLNFNQTFPGASNFQSLFPPPGG